MMHGSRAHPLAPPHRSPGVCALLVLFALGSAAPARAQDPAGRPASADTLRIDAVLDEMQAQLEVLLPAMQRLAQTMRESLPELEGDGAARPSVEALARRAARFTRAYFDALLAEGFSREEALVIVSGAGPPGARSRR